MCFAKSITDEFAASNRNCPLRLGVGRRRLLQRIPKQFEDAREHFVPLPITLITALADRH